MTSIAYDTITIGRDVFCIKGTSPFSPESFGMDRPAMLNTACPQGCLARYIVRDEAVYLEEMEVGQIASGYPPVGGTEMVEVDGKRLYRNIGLRVEGDTSLYLGRDVDRVSSDIFAKFRVEATLVIEEGRIVRATCIVRVPFDGHEEGDNLPLDGVATEPVPHFSDGWLAEMKKKMGMD